MQLVETTRSTRQVSPYPGAERIFGNEQNRSPIFSFSMDDSRSEVAAMKHDSKDKEKEPRHERSSQSEEFPRASTTAVEHPNVYENLRITVGHVHPQQERCDLCEDSSISCLTIVSPYSSETPLSSLEASSYHCGGVNLISSSQIRTIFRTNSSSFIDPFPTPTASRADTMECPEREYDTLLSGEKIRDGEGIVKGSTDALSHRTESTAECSESETDASSVVENNVATAPVATSALSSLTAENAVLAPELTNPEKSSLRRRKRFLPSPQQRQRAATALRSSIQNTSTRIRKLKLRPRRIPPPNTWLIPAGHPLKVAWDICTVFLSLVSAYLTHTSIRERDYDKTGFLIRFCEVWFLVDILLNFVTQYKVSGTVTLACPQKVWARYLTTWFIIDVTSFIPWEKIWVKPIVEMQKRRNILQKTGRRSKVALKIARMLRGRHIRWFNNVSRWTKHAGYGGNRLLALIIKYIPKYFVFCKNMKTVLAVRMLRQIHWVRKVMKNVLWKYKVEDEILEEVLEDDDEEDEDEDELETEYEAGVESFEHEEVEHLEHDDGLYEPPIG